MNSTLALISGLGLGLGLETSGLGLGLEALGLGLGFRLLALALKLPALLTFLVFLRTQYIVHSTSVYLSLTKL